MNVLVVGHRAGLVRALRALGVPFAVWNEHPVRSLREGEALRVAPFGSTPETSRRHAATFADLGPFTHVIAGTEAAVVPASHARRVLNARRSTHTKVQRCHHKLLMKQELRRHGVPMVDFVAPSEDLSTEAMVARLGLPLVVKSVASSGGRGIEFVHAPPAKPLDLRRRMVEGFISAREVSVESFVHDGQILFTNITTYSQKGRVNVVPTVENKETQAQLLALNQKVIGALRLDWGITHLEAYLCPGGPLFGEIALRPPGGYIMELMRLAYGFDPWQAHAQVELGQGVVLPDQPVAHAAAIILHPGAGRVARVPDLARVRSHPGVHRAKLKVEVGDEVAKRTGVGEDVGYVLACTDTNDALIELLSWLEVETQFELVGQS